jgi:predicted SnoaL-like aldol condensation-catalyzing enzyme
MSPARMAKIESGIRAVLEYNEAFNQHDVINMTRLLGDTCIFENTAPAPDGTVYKGKDTVTQYLQGFFQRSPHAHMEIEEIFGMGNRCILRWKYTWGDGHVRGVDIFKVEEGLITEKFSYVKG